MTTKQSFIIIVLPVYEATDTVARNKEMSELAARFASELTAACGAPPATFKSASGQFNFLAHGEESRVVRAVETARASNTQIFMCDLGGSYTTFGLATAANWLGKSR
jgi:hypothetical protein